MTRFDLQNNVIDSIKSINNIALSVATGVGKSKIALEAIDSVMPNANVLILVAERAHINNWKDEITKWEYTGNVTIVCYASMKKHINIPYDAIIFDEAHHLSSELRLEYLSGLLSKYKIFLSATLGKNLLDSITQICGYTLNVKYNFNDAINAGILAEPKITVKELILDNTLYNQTVVKEWGIKSKRIDLSCRYEDRWNYIRNKDRYPNARLEIRCTERQKYLYLTEQFEYYKRRYLNTNIKNIKTAWLNVGSQRKRFLGELKTKAAKDILKYINNKRYICFCTSINQAEELGDNNAIHSKRANSLDIINDFNNKKTSKLYAVNMAQEGLNLKDIEACLIIQLDGVERGFIQKMGRTMRGTNPMIYVLYYKDTRDEDYLKIALENIDRKYINII